MVGLGLPAASGPAVIDEFCSLPESPDGKHPIIVYRSSSTFGFRNNDAKHSSKSTREWLQTKNLKMKVLKRPDERLDLLCYDLKTMLRNPPLCLKSNNPAKSGTNDVSDI